MKEKILASLKSKYKTLGVSDKTFEGVADILAQTVTEETQIEATVSGAEGWLKMTQAEADRRVNDLRVKNQELEERLKKANPTPPANGNPGAGAEEIPAWFKSHQEQMQKLLDAETKRQQQQSLDGIRNKAKEIMKSKGIKESLCDNILAKIPASETDTAETISEKAVEEYNFIKKELLPEAGLPPHGGGGAGESVVKGFFDQKKTELELQQKLINDVKPV